MIDQEKQLHRIWERHPYASKLLKTECGKDLLILTPGKLNSDSGPDFFNARIELNGQLWVGNIEMHIRASDWKKHGHTHDKSYDSVILHVVLVNDREVHDPHGNHVPVLVLDEALLDMVTDMKGGEELMPVVSPGGLELFGVARLVSRAKMLLGELDNLKGDRDELFYRHLLRQFGMRTNSEPFQQLAHVLPYKFIQRQRTNLADIEALLFGQAGLLPQIPTDGYCSDLIFRYQHLAAKYELKPMKQEVWKFMRMRPSNFPTVRIAQIAGLFHCSDHLFAKIMSESSIEELGNLLDVRASSYWNNHFRFGVTSPGVHKNIGVHTVNSILINTVALLRFTIGMQQNDQILQENAINLLKNLPPENNSIVRAARIIPHNALESQGILELMTAFSDSKNKYDIETDDEPESCSEPLIPYISTRKQYDRQQTHRQNSILVRN